MASWKKIKSKIIHKNPWYVLREDDVIRPDGKPGKFYYVDEIDSVGVIAETDDDRIVLVGQTRYNSDNKQSWEVPGGKLKPGQTALEAAKDELREETGIKADEWVEIGTFYEALGFTHAPVTIFLAQGLSYGTPEPEATEDIQSRKYSIKEIEQLIAENKMFDSFSITALYKYKLYLENKS